ncbi:MAG TPA: M13 family metallopeptidase [Thermoanaerobaculia bacterium]|jgi:putative endopeptidase|nr:M13 family metallopeptidase [Thermoanaerobaculia bacterium]
MDFDAFQNKLPRSRHDGHLFALALPVLMAAALSWWLVSSSAAQAADDRKPSPLESAVDASITPGDDFFAYANGAWLKATTIPAGSPRWGARDELEELTRRRIATLLDTAGAVRASSAARKVADFRAAYLNEAAIEAKGVAPLKPLLDGVENVSDKTDLTRLLGRGMRADVDLMGFGIYNSASVLGLSVEQSIHGEKTNVAFLVQGGLGLPDRDDYLNAVPEKEALRARYRAYIARMLTFAGFDRADERATAVLALETAIAQTHATPEVSGADHNADNVWTRVDFGQRAPGMDWNVFFDAAGLAKQGEIVAWQPTAVTGVASLVASQPLEAWKDYLRFHVIHDYADVLPRAFAEEALALRVAAGVGPQPSRDERALAATQSAMGDALGRMYAERYFPAAQKARLERISDNVRAALIKRVEAATWMSPATKASALEKLRTLYVGLGYPDQWQDDSSLTVDQADPLGNLQRVSERNYRNAVARLGQPVNLKYWYIAPQKVGAVLVFQQNAYVMAAALLEPPKYDHTSSDAAAYGSVGALIGHDLTHYIDTLGADYDTEHRLRHWWTAEDTQRFGALTQPLVDQFSAYQPLPGLSINGKLTLTENIADLGGLAAAFDAYRETLGDRVTDRDYVRAQDREFFIAYAQTQRRKISDSANRKQIATNDHAPEDYRADTVRNLDEWYDAFDVRPGQRLYLAPAARVRVW